MVSGISVPGLSLQLPHLTGLTTCHICTGCGSPLPHLRRDLTPPTPAPGLGSPCHICAGTGAPVVLLHLSDIIS